MENAVNLKQASITTLARIITSLEQTGTPFNIWLEVPGKEKKPLKKFDQTAIDFPGDEQPKIKREVKAKTANGRGKYRKYENLYDVVVSRMDRGEKYTVASVAKSMYKEYGIRGKAKSKFHQAVYKVLNRSEVFEADKTTDPHLTTYSLR